MEYSVLLWIWRCNAKRVICNAVGTAEYLAYLLSYIVAADCISIAFGRNMC